MAKKKPETEIDIVERTKILYESLPEESVDPREVRARTMEEEIKAYSFLHEQADTMIGDPVETFNTVDPSKEIYTGGSSDYYKIRINNPTTPGSRPYVAECNDIIEALGMNFAEGNAFKALWRRAAHRTLKIKKKGYDGGKYDAEKVVFFGERLVKMSEES